MRSIRSLTPRLRLIGMVGAAGCMLIVLNLAVYRALGDDATHWTLKRLVSGTDPGTALRRIPVYPGATLTSLSGIPLRFATVSRGIWETDGSVPDVLQWYTRSLAAGGWRQTVVSGDPENASVQYLIFENTWKRRLDLSITAESRTTRIEIRLGPADQGDVIHMYEYH